MAVRPPLNSEPAPERDTIISAKLATVMRKSNLHTPRPERSTGFMAMEGPINTAKLAAMTGGSTLHTTTTTTREGRSTCDNVGHTTTGGGCSTCMAKGYMATRLAALLRNQMCMAQLVGPEMGSWNACSNYNIQRRSGKTLRKDGPVKQNLEWQDTTQNCYCPCTGIARMN
eukprot:1139560-Pelagomonas_calceolata.AAC.6